MSKKFSPIYLILTIAMLVTPVGNSGTKAAAALALPVNAAATIIHVPGDVATLQQAFDTVPQGGIIEIAQGTYTSPGSNGWVIDNINKQFTVRAASGATVILSGAGTRNIIRQINTNLSTAKPITFDHIIFANGYSASQAVSGGVTLYYARATFINCTFQGNQLSNAVTTPGGAVFVANDSVAFFINTTWTGNNALQGGALGIAGHSKVYIHQSEFLSNNNGNLYLSIGAAIYLANSTLRITNSRFDQNRVGLYGGAIYIIGTWTALPRTTPASDVIIANSLFTNNAATHDATSNSSLPTEGGAINIEDQSLVRIYNSRFINNRSNIAGAINDFRATVEVYGSVFLGNQANDTRGSSGVGGSINLVSYDGVSDGADNKPSASLKLSNSWLQGRYGTTTTSAISGACLFSNGDGSRIENNDGIPNVGTLADNQARVTVTNSVFYDCDTAPSADNKSAAGAIYTVITNLTFQNNIIANSDSTTSNSIAGAMSLLYNTTANITESTLSGNTANTFGGAVFAQGSNVSISNSKLFENASPGLGSAIFSSIDDARKINMTGLIQNNIISNNPGPRVIFDDDRNIAGTPYNDLKYNGNTIYKGSQSTNEYYDSLVGGKTVAGLNDLVVSRNVIGVNTDKSPLGNNTSASSKPVLGTILAAPAYTLSNHAAGEASNPTANVLYTWSGGNATFNGGSVSGVAGSASVSTPGTQTLAVGTSSFTTSVTSKSNPSATFSASAGTPPNFTLNWALQSGTFLDAAIDQGVSISSAASGSVGVVSSTGTVYRLYVVTEEGGFVATVDTSVPLLSAPDSVVVLVTLSPLKNNGTFEIRNNGGSTLNWTAQSADSWINITTPSGQTSSSSLVKFTVSKNTVGDITGTIKINSDGGNKDVSIKAVVVNTAYPTFLPAVSR